MKEVIKTHLENNLGLYAGIVLAILIVWGSIYASAGLFLMVYFSAPIFIWKRLKDFRDYDDAILLITPVLLLAWYVCINVAFVTFVWG